ncbi:dihydrofolate reductase [bacterium]|nr:MAG: dihydrofolate reductase [bacterium]
MFIIIAALAQNRVIGKDNDLPWHFPEDLKRFKELTFGHPVIMGWNTFVSIIARIGKPLPGRIHFVLTSKKRQEIIEALKAELPEKFKDFSIDNYSDSLFFSRSLGNAVQKGEALSNKVFAIGGERVYTEALKSADKLELTLVKRDYEGDAFFPEFDENNWEKQPGPEEKVNSEYEFATYKRIGYR